MPASCPSAGQRTELITLFLIPVPFTYKGSANSGDPPTTSLKLPAAHYPVRLFRILAKEYLVDTYVSVSVFN